MSEIALICQDGRERLYRCVRKRIGSAIVLADEECTDEYVRADAYQGAMGALREIVALDDRVETESDEHAAFRRAVRSQPPGGAVAMIFGKACTKCGRVLSLEGFHRSQSAKDGRQSRCKDCQRVGHREWVRANRERANERLRRWRADNPDLEEAARLRWEAANADKVRIHHKVQDAVRFGTLTKPTACEGCGAPTAKPGLHAHHEDYSRPLDVQWLCAQCHRDRHPREIRTAAA